MDKAKLLAYTLTLAFVSVGYSQNLVVNGDFEGGSAGWTTWAGGWSVGHSWDFTNADGGQLGANALKLNINPGGEGSYGVYQEIAVTPGTTYRIDAYWKGTRYGVDNWYEVILLDGPWDPDQADSGGQVVYDNFMYGYDSQTYAIPSDFGWLWAHTQNGTPVDWNSRFGKRVATGSIMTVVLKAGACCSSDAAEVWFDEVSLVDATVGNCSSFVNGDFTEGLNNWTTWTHEDTGSDLAVAIDNGGLAITGSNFNGGVYQQFSTGGAGTVINVLGVWRSDPTVPEGLWAEVLVINGDRVPVDGTDETDGVNGATVLYRNDTFAGRDAWDGAIPLSSPVKYQSSFVAAGDSATIILKAGTNNGSPAGVRFDDMAVHCVPLPATVASLPTGYVSRSYTFPGGSGTNIASIAQSPVSRRIYVVRNGNGDTLYELNIGGGSLSVSVIGNLDGYVFTGGAQGITFDPDGNIYVSSREGDILKGVDTNADPTIDAFSFSKILNLPEQNLGTFHGVGGVAVGPDNLLYINSGSESFYGYLPDGTPEEFLPEYDPNTGTGWWNGRILRCSLDGGVHTVETFADGIRNSFDITFRADGLLFGVENGPNEGCDYAEELNLISQGGHYGFPFEYGSDLSGSDASIACQNSGGGNVLGPPPLPAGITPTPALVNFGPDAVPTPGQGGYVDGGPYWGFDPHSGPDGLDFYEPEFMDAAAIKFPAEFHGRAFVGRFGQLEVNYPDRGRDLLTLRMDDASGGFACNEFLVGMGRVIDVLCAYNGKVYVVEFDQSTTGPAVFTSNSRITEIAYTIPADEPNILLNTNSIAISTFLGMTPANSAFTVTNNGGGTLVYTVSESADWIEPVPGSGSSTGEVDMIELAYDVTGLSCGEYFATVTVADPNAVNLQQQINVQLTVVSVSPDYDCDGDVDQSDFGFMQACYTGSGGLPSMECENSSLDGDEDIDAQDHAIFMNCLAGEGVAATPGCDDY